MIKTYYFIVEKSQSKYMLGKMLAEENSRFILTHFCDLINFPSRSSKMMPSLIASDPYFARKISLGKIDWQEKKRSKKQ